MAQTRDKRRKLAGKGVVLEVEAPEQSQVRQIGRQRRRDAVGTETQYPELGQTADGGSGDWSDKADAWEA